jgi:hypothetical protein
MPSVQFADGALNYQLDGPAGAPVLLQSAIYCGISAPNATFLWARKCGTSWASSR